MDEWFHSKVGSAEYDFDELAHMMKRTSQQGFAMLFTVLVVSLILTIALSISNITFKQTLLSSLAKDSRIAFYQADAGIECALYYDTVSPELFPLGSDAGSVPQTLTCGNDLLTLDTSNSFTDYFFYVSQDLNQSVPCFSVTIDKQSEPGKTVVQARGNNTCVSSIRQVERALEARY